jgi:hypothetical protein
MHRKTISKFLWSGIIGAAGGFLVPLSHATGWCPTSTDYQITCSNCSRQLTCDLNGIGIEIHGVNDTLDGQNHSISNAPYDGILVANYSGASNAIIQNLNIYDPAESGIRYYAGSSSYDWGYVDNVYVSGAYFSAMENQTYNPLQISNSWAYNSQNGVVASPNQYTDFLTSSAQGNSSDGYLAGGHGGSFIWGDYFWNNGGSGANVSGSPNTWVDGTTFSSNNGTGLTVYSSDGTYITNSTGNLSVGYDCVVSNSNYTYASGNSWGSYSGLGCIQ